MLKKISATGIHKIYFFQYLFLCMWLQIRIPAISLGHPYRRRDVTLKSIANGQVAVPAYLRFSTFEFTSYTYKMLENRIEGKQQKLDFICKTAHYAFFTRFNKIHFHSSIQLLDQ